MAHDKTWKTVLEASMDDELAAAIDIFEKQIELRRENKLSEKVFAETRLRRGVYGQRYDNGQRHDGIESRTLDYPCGEQTKGPNTVWDAPGMMRIKIPMGRLNPEQMDLLADLSEEYADGICHVTTRQDVQLHFVHIDDTPTLMRRLAAVGITTQEACGNAVRNTTACPLAGVCTTEPFDVTPYAEALTHYLMGHDDTQDFGRKFKVAFSGCRDQACGLVTIHDLGFIAATRNGDKGFEVWVGGGLGAVPHRAQLFVDFIPEAELLPLSLAICRVFARLGEKRNRARARLKFVIAKLGLERFREEVEAERQALRHDARWTAYLPIADSAAETPLIAPEDLLKKTAPEALPEDYQVWLKSNVQAQRQPGYSVVTVQLPLGDLSAEQMRHLADIAREHNGGTVRASVEQNLVLRWIPNGALAALHQQLCDAGLGAPGAGSIVDVSACPGTDTCKLGIAASRGLAAELSERLALKNMQLDEAIGGLRIKVSGCFNSCGQHHIADIGFWGVGRKANGFTVPHFQAVLGGQWSHNGNSYGLAVGAIPSRNVPEAVDQICADFVAGRQSGESFQSYVGRVGKGHMRQLLKPLMHVPAFADDPSYYSDWGDPRRYGIGDLGVGECAGEVVSFAEFGLAASEREVFEAQALLEGANPEGAGHKAYAAMVTAAKALTKEVYVNIGNGNDEIVTEFRQRLYDTKVFFDPFAGGKFGAYLLRAHDERDDASVSWTAETARQRIEEAQLFVEAAHSCYGRMVDQRNGG